MSLTLLAALLLAAVLLFWVIGAHNRLVAMRNDIASAWSKVQAALDQRGAAVEPLMAALMEPMAAEQGALHTWAAAHTLARQAAATLAARPVGQAQAQAWVAAEAALAAATSRVLALLGQDANLRGQDSVASPAAQWADGQARLPFARQLFNEAASAYNEALGVFPTRWVARGLGLQAGGLI